MTLGLLPLENNYSCQIVTAKTGCKKYGDLCWHYLHI